MNDDLADFLAGYITCALWASTDQSRADGGDELDKNYNERDLASDTVERMIEDCRCFMRENPEMLKRYCDALPESDNYRASEGSPMAYAGHDLWLTRNGHGAGYWDRGVGDCGDYLSTSARKMGEIDLYPGDDGKLYI